jgi:hypothetical protein
MPGDAPHEELRALKAELRSLVNSMEYAFAMGAIRTMGARDPRLEHVVTRVRELERRIATLEPRTPGD